MNITADEKQMYQVMKALYESGIPICFKGSMVLKACLNEAGYVDEVRRTVDIDANWNSEEPPTAEQLVSSLQSVLDRNNLQIDVQMFRMYAEDRSAGFMLTDRTTGAELFSKYPSFTGRVFSSLRAANKERDLKDQGVAIGETCFVVCGCYCKQYAELKMWKRRSPAHER